MYHAVKFYDYLKFIGIYAMNANLINYFYDILFPYLDLENEGKECYKNCGYKQGPCEWCGSEGVCCSRKSDWNDTTNGCNGSFGGKTRHECVPAPGTLFNIIFNDFM